MSSRRGEEQLKRQALTDVFNVLEKRKGAIAEQQETFRKEAAIEAGKVDVTVGDRSFRVDPGDAFKHFSKLEEKKKAGDVTVPVKIDTPEGSRTFNVKEKDALDYYADQAKGPVVKTPAPVTWSKAGDNLSQRFGSQDPTGRWSITKSLQGQHRVAQKKLVDLKASGVEPLDAVNKAEDYSRNVEAGFWNVMSKNREEPSEQERIKAEFLQQFGYLPGTVPGDVNVEKTGSITKFMQGLF